VVYVETPDETPERISPETERTLLRNVELARELGAEVVRLKAKDPVPALIDFGRAHGVAHLLIGRSARRNWRRLLRRPPGGSWLDVVRGPFHERLLRQAADFDVYVVAQEEPRA
jgi:two-component system sensor histidine kinase KdpD